MGGECETKFAHEGTLYLPSVEYYDPIHNEWTTIKDMKHPRSFTAVAVLGSESLPLLPIFLITCSHSSISSLS